MNATPPRVIRQPLRMITRGGRNHSALAFRRTQSQQFIQRAALFERACSLQIVQFEMDRISRQLRKCFRARTRRQINRLGDPFRSRFNIRKSNHCLDELVGFGGHAFPDLASYPAKAIVEYTYAISGKGARET